MSVDGKDTTSANSLMIVKDNSIVAQTLFTDGVDSFSNGTVFFRETAAADTFISIEFALDNNGIINDEIQVFLSQIAVKIYIDPNVNVS